LFGYLGIRIINSVGLINFCHTNIPIHATDTHIIDFGAWKGKGYITLEIDHGSDGTIGETVKLENQMKYVFLPVISLRK
jgi:hypothetical protein